MNRSQSRCESVCGSPVPAEEVEEHRGRDPVAPPGPLALRRRHLFPVDFKKPPQRKRLGLGLRLAVGLKGRETRGGLVGLPLRASPIAVLQGPAQPAPVLPPLDLEQAGFRIGKDPDPVPAPFSGAVRAPDFVSCVPSFDSSRFDGLHDPPARKLAGRRLVRQSRDRLARSRFISSPSPGAASSPSPSAGNGASGRRGGPGAISPRRRGDRSPGSWRGAPTREA